MTETQQYSFGDVVDEIIGERCRQVHGEGFSPERDDGYTTGQLAKAAAAYVSHASSGAGRHRPAAYVRRSTPTRWPWSHLWWKPTTPRRDLIKAAALIIAEIERLDRIKARP